MKYLFILACLLPFWASAQKSKYVGVYSVYSSYLDGNNTKSYLYLSIDSFRIVSAVPYYDDFETQSISGSWSVEKETINFTNKSGLNLHCRLITNDSVKINGFPDFLMKLMKESGSGRYAIEYNNGTFFHSIALINP